MVEADGANEDLPRQIAALEKALVGDGLLDARRGDRACGAGGGLLESR